MKARFIRIGKHFINPAYIVAVNESPDQPGGIRVWLTGNVYDYLDFEGNEARALLAWVTSSSDDLIIRATGAIARQWVTCCRCGDKVPQSDAVSAVGMHSSSPQQVSITLLATPT